MPFQHFGFSAALNCFFILAAGSFLAGAVLLAGSADKLSHDWQYPWQPQVTAAVAPPEDITDYRRRIRSDAKKADGSDQRPVT